MLLLKPSSSQEAANIILSELKSLHLNESGLLPFFNAEEIKADTENETVIETKNFLEKSEQCIAIGDRSLTTPCLKALSGKFSNSGLIVFDSHPNCMTDHEDPDKNYLKLLIEQGIIKKENVVLIGLRSWHRDEHKFLKDNKIKTFTMKEISAENLNEISDSVMSVAKNFNALYLSISISAVDPAFAPGTNEAEPGGLTSRELLFLLSRLKMLKNLKFIDLVGMQPEKDINSLTAKLGAKIISEMC
ncbi:arginase family protein [Candidatus Woesearchaeota archaeon]|nr:arginase family protein [Candidatus Woesearchaeota archaeon]